MASARRPKPTYKQCERWRFSLENALQDPAGFDHFYAFLQQYESERRQPEGEYTRYLDFWNNCHEYTNSAAPMSESKKEALKIYNLYLAPKADKKIGLGGDDDIVIRIKKLIDETEDNEEEDGDGGKRELLLVFDEALDNMWEYLDEGGCCGAYGKWKSELKPEPKKTSEPKCRLF